MSKSEKIIKKLKEIKPQLEKEYGVSELGVFGSYIKNENTHNSDIDILISFKHSTTLFKFCALENFLSDFLKKKVDLVMKKSLKPNIGKQILKEVVYV